MTLVLTKIAKKWSPDIKVEESATWISWPTVTNVLLRVPHKIL